MPVRTKYAEWDRELKGYRDPWDRAIRYAWQALAVAVAVGVVAFALVRL